MSDLLAMIGRVAMAAFFIWSGLTKFNDPTGATATLAGAVTLPPWFPPIVAVGAIIALEVGGGVLLLFGVAARSAAVVLAGWCVLTGVLVHLPIHDPPNMLHFYKNIAIAGGLLLIAAYGPGALGVRGIDYT